MSARAAAVQVVTDIATRLADPAKVAELMAGSDRWMPLSLTDGFPATALLHAELANTDAAHRRVAHAHLAAAASAPAMPVHGLFIGPGALAFAAAQAARKPGEYAGLLIPLDTQLVDWTHRTLRAEFERIAAGRSGTTFGAYDAVTGVTGVGRHLLQRGDTEAVAEIARYLVKLVDPIDGLPGWWVTDSPPLPAHANSGLAHGIPGPLVLLALAWQAGIRVPGQGEAIDGIVSWLLTWSDHDDHGRYWSDTLTADDLRSRPDALRPARSAWCYGTPGVAVALHIAGTATNRPEWTEHAVAATKAMLRRPLDSHGIHDVGLCHGWAGLLTLVLRLARDTADPDLLAAADRVALRAVDGYDPDHPSVGFLEGAAGTALALHGWLTPPTTDWAAALLAA
ncbi:lanthionine synthetase C family protein [Actinokineospora sp. HUAS TT18]|uniref:lanthionine synthetase C family protein n=1 Tax=Actinokineospora sp. HUAS TT18 TaxID=3447451 RepID=UPI003F51E621